MTDGILYHNGTWLPDNDTLFTARDRLRLGDGVFDTILCVNGKCVFQRAHYERLKLHAQILAIPFDLNEDEHSKLLADLTNKNNAYNGRYAINLLLSRGVSLRGVMPPDQPAPSLTAMIAAAPSLSDFPPINAIIAKTVHKNEGSPLSQIKSCNYGDHILALNEAKQAQANEAILLNNAGHIACSSAGNIYIQIDGQLITPPLADGAMDGTIRQGLIQAGIAHERSLNLSDINNAAAIYISNSIKGLAPIATLDGRALTSQPLPFDVQEIPAESDLAIALGLAYT